MACSHCHERKAVVVRARTREKVCRECFFELFEKEIHDLIVTSEMFHRGECVGVGVSGGKDSTVLIYVLDKLNKKYDYGVELVMLCVDEGIAGYRDKSIETVHLNQQILGLPLRIMSYDELFGITMDSVVRKIGLRGNCSYCGVFRRQALEKAAQEMGANCIVTGHNADDMAETIILNLLRGDTARFCRCTQSRTQHQVSESGMSSLSRCKPFKHTHQKDIVFYAYLKKLPYFTTECTYAPNASRGDARNLVKKVERIDPASIRNIIRAAEMFKLMDKNTTAGTCQNCAHPSSSPEGICSACRFLHKLRSIP